MSGGEFWTVEDPERHVRGVFTAEVGAKGGGHAGGRANHGSEQRPNARARIQTRRHGRRHDGARREFGCAVSR